MEVLELNSFMTGILSFIAGFTTNIHVDSIMESEARLTSNMEDVLLLKSNMS